MKSVLKALLLASMTIAAFAAMVGCDSAASGAPVEPEDRGSEVMVNEDGEK
jgi:hypothetical protein